MKEAERVNNPKTHTKPQLNSIPPLVVIFLRDQLKIDLKFDSYVAYREKPKTYP